jgi:AcrR family transcriptional regulator
MLPAAAVLARGDALAFVAPRAAVKPALPEAGLRERNKAEKLRRIRRAARELFIEKGYDDTTTRAIARRAGVGLGTLFTYAADKRDLLFLIFNDELECVAEAAFGAASPDLPLLDRLVEIFGVFYSFFAQQPHLARFLLRELTFYLMGSEAQRFQEHRDRILTRLSVLVDEAKENGQIGTGESSAIIGRAIFSLYTFEIRHWLSAAEAAPDLARGLGMLRRLLGLLIDGLKPLPGGT